MRIGCNLHTHTVFSDGRNTAEEMVAAALERGFFTLGFSDHGVATYDSAGMSPEAERAYIAEIRRLKEKYAGQIEIVLGCEHDFSMPGYDLSPYDYVIESVHLLRVADGVYGSVDRSEATLEELCQSVYGGDMYALCGRYFDDVCRSIEETRADIVGHIGLAGKFNEGGRRFDFADPRYVRPALEALRCAAERNLLVEINTGAMARGYRTSPYPEPALLRPLRDFGGRILFSSDCHAADQVDFAFDQAVSLARAAGFREYWVWKDGGFAPRAL